MCAPHARPVGEVEGGGNPPNRKGRGRNPLNSNALSSHTAHRRVRGGHPPIRKVEERRKEGKLPVREHLQQADAKGRGPVGQDRRYKEEEKVHRPQWGVGGSHRIRLKP